jgi:hypothetical protein
MKSNDSKKEKKKEKKAANSPKVMSNYQREKSSKQDTFSNLVPKST